MQSKIQISVLSGIVAIIVMTLIMIGALIEMPKMSPPDVIAMSVSVAMVWVIHFVITTIFDAGYVYSKPLKRFIVNICMAQPMVSMPLYLHK